MSIDNKDIIECAKSLGFNPPKRVKIQKWESSNENLFPVAKSVWYYLKPSDIKVSRATTTFTSEDLGEWWISYPQSLTFFRVTDEDFKVFIRDSKIKSILKRKFFQTFEFLFHKKYTK